MSEDQGPYVYFLTRLPVRVPLMIRLAQWGLLAVWLMFGHWIFAGRGYRYLLQYFSVYHGVFADNVALKAGILPNWGLVTLALGALLLWLQLLWARCRTSVRGEEAGWVWSGRKGPARPTRAVLTAGGAWLSENGRWYLVPKGYVDAGGRDWLLASGATRLAVFHWRSLISPLTLLLLVLVAGAYALQRPVVGHRETRTSIYLAAERGPSELQAAAAQHPDFRPWARYLSALAACDKAACLRSQITDRLEMMCIGPNFGGDGGTLFGLLLLAGRSKLALKVMHPSPGQALDIALRLGHPEKAKAILEASSLASGAVEGKRELLLLEEGRYGEAWQQAQTHAADDTLSGVAQRTVVAQMSGHQPVARALAVKLLSPGLLRQVRLEGAAPDTGLGALQRPVRDVKHSAARALGFAVLGNLPQAEEAWDRAEKLAVVVGIPGALDRERIYLDLVAPGGSWSGRARRRADSPAPGAALPNA